jgi:hypothetical protein
MGIPTHPKLFAFLTFLVYAISQLNFCIAIRIYRRLSIWDSFIHSFEVTSYVYAHWVPVIIVSFVRILAGKGSTWHPTEKGHSLVEERQRITTG